MRNYMIVLYGISIKNCYYERFAIFQINSNKNNVYKIKLKIINLFYLNNINVLMFFHRFAELSLCLLYIDNHLTRNYDGF